MTDAGLGPIARQRSLQPVGTPRRSFTRRALEQKPPPPTWRDRFLTFNWFTYLVRSFLVAVIAPTVVVAIYYVVFATPTYTAESQFAVRPAADRPLLDSYLDESTFDILPSPTGERVQAAQAASASSGGGSSSQASGTGSAASLKKKVGLSASSSASQIAGLALSALGTIKQDNEGYMLAAFIGSQSIVNALDEDGWLRARFAAGQPNWFQAPPSGGSQEALLHYWEKAVVPSFDTNTGLFDLTVTAFTPQDALAISQRIVEQGEALINRLSERARQNRIEQAKKEIDKAEQRYLKAETDMRAFRSEQNLVDPEKVATSTYAQMLDLLSSRIALDVQLRMFGTSLDSNAPQVKSIRQRIAALDHEIDKIKAQLTDRAGAPDAASHYLGAFEQLETERQLAQVLYSSALDEMDQARLETERQSVYLTVYSPPTLPLNSSGPQTLKAVGTIFFLAFILWAISSTIIAAARDHLS